MTYFVKKDISFSLLNSRHASRSIQDLACNLAQFWFIPLHHKPRVRAIQSSTHLYSVDYQPRGAILVTVLSPKLYNITAGRIQTTAIRTISENQKEENK